MRLLNRSAGLVITLFVATTLLTGFTACAEKDVPVITPEKPQSQDLIGTWRGNYPRKGTIEQYGKNFNYNYAEQALTFNADGTGTCYKFLCNAAGEPVTLYGGAGDVVNGRFHYAVDKDGVITITRDGDGNSDNPKTWLLRFGADGLNGTDGTTPYQLQSADAKWQTYITNLEKEFRNSSGMFSSESQPSFLTDWQQCRTVRLSNTTRQGQYVARCQGGSQRNDQRVEKS